MPYSIEEISSPDPLQDSPTYSSPVKTRNATRPRRSLPLQGSSPRKQTFELDVGNKISPQKIRVTVEADHSDQEIGPGANGRRQSISPTPYRAPTIRRKEKTTTTTIPVKGLSDSEDDVAQIQTPKRGRGRPRKSVGTPVPAKSQSRNVTPSANPSPRRRRTLGSLVDGDDEEDWDFAIGAGVEVGRGKGRSRSRSVISNSRKSATPAPQSGIMSDKPNSSARSRKGRGRRKTLTPGDVFILEDDPGAVLEDQNLDRLSSHEGRALAPLTGNIAIKALEASSNTSPEEHDCDVPLSKFTPARRTPAYTSQSALQCAIESPAESQKLSGGKLTGLLHQDAPEPIESVETSDHSGENKSHRQEDYEEEGDALGDLPEFDTILESEGFSMISVESVPSLREYLSSPSGGFPSNQKNTPVPINRTVASLNQAMGVVCEDSFSSVAPEILEAATPGRRQNINNRLMAQHVRSIDKVNFPKGSSQTTPALKPHNNKILSVRQSERNPTDDSFSSIPPEVFEAATPARHVQKNALGYLKANELRGDGDSFSTIPSDILEAATPGKPRRDVNSSAIKAQAAEATVETISSSPLDILEAATPSNKFDIALGSGKTVQNHEGITGADSKLLIPEVVNGLSSDMRRATSRLLTPEETPSPPQEIELQQKPTLSLESQKTVSEQQLKYTQEPDASSLMYTQMDSSPPLAFQLRSTHSTHLNQHQFYPPDGAQTPSIVFSSPTLPPLVQQLPLPRRSLSIVGSRTGNSHEASIVPSLVAGKALQELSVPSSTRSRTQSLGSPFKSPVARRSSSAASSGVLSSDVSHGGQQAAESQISKAGGDMFGGFSDDTRRELRRSLMMGEELARSQNSTQANRRRNDTLRSREEDPFSNVGHQLRSPSPEERQEYMLELPSSSRISKPGSSKQTSSSHSYDMMSSRPKKIVPVKDSSNDVNQVSQDIITVLKRGNNTPRTSELYNGLSQIWKDDREEQWARERAAVSQQIEAASTSQVIVLSSDDSKTSISLSADSDEEDIWQAEARHSSSLLEEQSQQESRRQERTEKPRRSKIPSPWTTSSKQPTYSGESSNASLKPAAENKVIYPSQLLPESQSTTIRHDTQHTGLRIEKRNTLFNNGMDMTLPKTSQETVRRVTMPPGSISDEDGLSEIDASFCRPIPQKMNFAPRPRTKLDLSALLASSPIKARVEDSSFMTSSPMKHRDESSIIDISAALRSQLVGDEYGELHNSTLKSTLSPDKSITKAHSSTFENFDSYSQDHSSGNQSNISATKSVSSDDDTELESSVLSKAVSQDDSTEDSPNHYPAPPGPLSPNRSATPSKSCIRTSNTTSPTKSVAWQSPATSPPPLSSTTWSKSHWKLLDGLWKDYFELGPECFGDGNAGRKSKYVGKMVESDGEVLKLEPWHLDIVAAFREEVPGWEEHVIAFRLFALIVGERRRKEQRA